MGRSPAKKADTSVALLEAAKAMLRKNGYASFSTRDVAAAAGVPLSQIHYHFGSKQGMMLALFEYLNAQLLDRQSTMFAESTLTLSSRWDRACDYLDDDIASGYVHVLQELMAAGWSDPEVGKVIRAGLLSWYQLIRDVMADAAKNIGGLGPFTPEDIAALVSNAFMGAESLFLIGFEKKGAPVRRALRRVGDLIRIAEAKRETNHADKAP